MGWQDAPRVKDWLADLSYVDTTLRERGISLDAIYSSELERARQTAAYYGHSHGIPIVHDSPALNEVDYGALSTRSKTWVQDHIPEHKRDPDFVYPGGESFRQMQRRSTAFVSSLTGTPLGNTVLLVVHAGVIRGLVSHFLSLDYAAQLNCRISHRYIGEFLFAGQVCVCYDEWGKASGFARGPQRVRLPWRRPADVDSQSVRPTAVLRGGCRPER